MIVGMAPVRISFAGGGTDMPEYYEKFGGAVISTNINLFTYLVVNPRRDNSFQAFSSDFESHHMKSNYDRLEMRLGTELTVSAVKFLKYKIGGDFLICSDVPPGSGLGASSSLAVNSIKTISFLKGKNWKNEKIAEAAFHIEREILKHKVGKQDDYISAFGGFNYINFTKNRIKVNPIKLKKSTASEFEQNLLLFYIGVTRNSNIILSKQLEYIKKNNHDTINSLHYVRNLVEEFRDSLNNSDLREVGELLHKGWMAKRKFVKGISNNHIDKIYEVALKAGAIGGKLTGAGGGGHLLLYCESSKRQNVIRKMQSLKLKHIPGKFHSEGIKILNLYNYSK
mgnify:CR=1 FL=1